MSFKTSDEIVYGLNSAVIDLEGFFVLIENPSEDNFILVENPKVVVDLLTPEELKRYVNLTSASIQNKAAVENVIVRDKITEVIGYKGKNISILASPAGVISTIAGLIFNKSFNYLQNVEENYHLHMESISVLDQMCGIISYYLNTPYEVVKNLPVNEIFKRHAICCSSFPHQVNDLRVDSN